MANLGYSVGGGAGLTPSQEILLNGAIQSTEKGVANGVMPLDSNGKAPLINLPNNLKEIKIVATITDRDNIIVGDRFEGLYVLVEDATGDPTVTTGYATYILKAGLLNTDWFKTGEGESIDLILSAINTSYDNTTSLLTATTVQGAIDELISADNIVLAKLTELQENLKIVGFVNKNDTTLSWNDTNRTATLNIDNSTQIYINGKLYDLPIGIITKQISNVEGQHYIYFDVDVNNNVIIEETTSFTEDLITKYCIIAYCYFDATNSKAVLGLQDERHGMTMDCDTHLYLHNTIGTAYQSGLLPSVIADGDGSVDSHIQMAGASGIIEDEDLKHTIPSRASTDNITIIYRDGANGNWVEHSATNKIVIPAGTGRASYNQNNLGVWQLTEIANNDFGICYAFVCPSIDNSKKWFIILGTDSYSNVNNAREAASILPDLGVLPFKEYKLVAGFIYKTSNSYANSVKSKIVSIDGISPFIDFRTSTSVQNAPINASDVVNLQNQINLKQNNIISVANQAAMLALTGKIVGDIVIRKDDNNYQYRLNALPVSNLSNWEVLGKDAQPVGETVEDIVTTNEVITSKVNGLYAFTGTPNGGFPVGVAQGDIAQKTANVWTVVYTFIDAPASIYSKSDGQTYDKKVNSSNVNNWVAKPKETYYEIGSNKEFSTINSAFAQFVIDGVPVGTGQLYDSEINERAIFPANAQNFLLKGEGYVERNNNLVNNFEILGHRFTLQKCQPNCSASLVNVARTVTTTLNSKNIVITGAGQTTVGLVKYQKITGTGIPPMSYVDTIVDLTTFTISQNATANGTNIATIIQPKAPVVIDSNGTITENTTPNIKRGKHCFDDISFSTPGASALDIFDIGNWADFRNCNFSGKEINLYTTSTTPVYISFTNCQQGVINIYSPFIIVTKAYSPSVTIKTIINQGAIIDFDKAIPVAYSILRQYSLGQTTSIPLGAMIINDDVGGTLQMLKCTTAYTIAITPSTGTPIDLTKYQIQTITNTQLEKAPAYRVKGNNTNANADVTDLPANDLLNILNQSTANFNGLGQILKNNRYTATNTPAQTLNANFTGGVIPATNTNSITITPAINSYFDGSLPQSWVNLSSFPCYVAGIPIGAKESISLLPNATAQWESADKKYEILNITAHGFTNALDRHKFIVKLQTNNTYVFTDGADENKVSYGKMILNVIDANNILVGNGGKITTFTDHGFIQDISYTYGNPTNGGIGNMVDGETLTTGNRATIPLLSVIDNRTLDFSPKSSFISVNPVPVQTQIDSATKRYVLTDGARTNDVNATNNIITGVGSNQLIFSGGTKTVYGKFAGKIEELISTNITKLATQIPVFNATNPTLSTVGVGNNINSAATGDYIIAINKAKTNGDGIFAIPVANFTDAVNNVATSITSGKIGFQLNPVVGYRHNGTALEQYDFINMGLVNWNGTNFTSIINDAFNGIYETKIVISAGATTTLLNHNLGTTNVTVTGNIFDDVQAGFTNLSVPLNNSDWDAGGVTGNGSTVSINKTNINVATFVPCLNTFGMIRGYGTYYPRGFTQGTLNVKIERSY